MNDEIKELFEEIQDWMMDNDYECGVWGSEIYRKIKEILKEHELKRSNRNNEGG